MFILQFFNEFRDTLIIGGSKGVPGTHPPRCPNSFNFMQFWGENWPNNGFSHPSLELVPHFGELLDRPLHFIGKNVRATNAN